ncbi:MAG: hypothetical protein ACYTGK_14315 [Planctomycetota bacterium]
MRILVVSLLLVSLAPARDYGGLLQAAGLRCACAKVECGRCARRGDAPAYCAGKATELARWGDIARWRIALEFTTPSATNVEAYERLEMPLVAAYGGRLAQRNLTLTARLKPSREARIIYIRQLPRGRDPLLVLRRGPGTLDVRVFPVARHRPAYVTLAAYALTRYRGFEGVRLYRTGRRYLAVVTGRPERGAAPDFVDKTGGRYLYFMSAKMCRKRFGDRPVRYVPCVRHLETAVTGRGHNAASLWTTLAAFPRRVKLPGHEFFAAVP